MSNANQPSLTQPDAGQRSGFARLMLEQWPYVLLFVAVIAGVAFTDMRLEFALLYWQILIPVFGLVALAIGWNSAGEDAKARTAFALKTIMHWGALFVLVWILYLPQLKDVLNAELTGLQIIFLLGLTAFLSGVHGNPRMSVIGVFLIVSGIVVAFLDDAALMMSVLAVAVMVGLILWQKFAGGKSAD
ncbi:hypothetical protein [Thiocapsa rosea]|uniref:Uncharacterized protein n=1 Tax=Thiocapsa rosea TaxID=69360 RepID=A0A495V630_9GAMM|nr:hypothetical protein [Thiocapsa rosea]RKT44846.1 hypothetical protein BDD21_2250 [Thiocapsa rosea]